MFIDAPGERRNRVRELLSRSIFRSMRLAEKMRYLSYERVQEVDKFFGDESAGLNVGVLVGRSEILRG